MLRSILILFVSFPLCFLGKQKVYTPDDFGFSIAKNGEERFTAIYQAHKAAHENGGIVSYEGIETVDLVIPDNAQSIPLTQKTDFNGVVFNVLNTKTDFYLFTLAGPREIEIPLGKNSLDKGRFRQYRSLRRGYHLLLIEDKTPWVKNRKGYQYGAIRKDILFIKNGRAKNTPISHYDNEISDPRCLIIEATTDLKYFRNVTLSRDARSSKRTFFVKVSNLNNVELSGLTIHTPEPTSMDRDAAIRVVNCTNVSFKDINIDRTYSGQNIVGYGFVMNNVWNAFFFNVHADGNWGVFDNNNISDVYVEDSEINRFDLHCYGRDFSFTRCQFNRVGQPLSSYFGRLVFKDCLFDHVISCSTRQEYNAYTSFDIEYDHCVFNLDNQHSCLVNMFNLSNELNARPELSNKCLPNLTIKNCVVNLEDDMKKCEIVRVGKVDYVSPLSGISRIIIDGLKVNGAEANVYLFSSEIKTENEVELSFSHIDLLQKNDDEILQATAKYSYEPSMIFNINHGKSQRITVFGSRMNYNAVENPQYDISFEGCTVGRLRSYNTGNGIVSSRRSFVECKIILDCDDSSNYLIDANSDYRSCLFIPCDKKRRIIPASMEEGSYVTFENCSVQGGSISVDGFESFDLLQDSRIEIPSKRVTRINGKPIERVIND